MLSGLLLLGEESGAYAAFLGLAKLDHVPIFLKMDTR